MNTIIKEYASLDTAPQERMIGYGGIIVGIGRK